MLFTREYRFKFYLNARHTMNNDGSGVHPHTWEIVLYVVKKSDAFIQFTTIEKYIEQYFTRFEGALLNEMSPFNNALPIMENIGDVFHRDLLDLLTVNGWTLTRLEISENPTRSYIVASVESSALVNGAAEFRANIKEQETEMQGSLSTENNEHEDTAAQDEAAIETTEVSPVTDEARADESRASGLHEETIAILEKVQNEVNTGSKKNILSNNIIYFTAGMISILMLSLLLIYWITRTGIYPWGSDSWYHLFKGDLLYKSISSGNFYPLYTDLWYNGIEPLRYWAPLPHYLLALFEFITGGSIGIAYNIFIAAVFVTGGFGWLIWGVKTGRKGLAMALAILWFFLPDNLRVLFSEGNISRVVVTTLFPYLLLNVWCYLEYKKKRNLLGIILFMLVITLCHAMIAAMTGVTLFLFVIFWRFFKKDPGFKACFTAISGLLTGIMLAGIWLYPALKGGLVSQDKDAVGELMKSMTYQITESLNPILKLHNPDTFYFGLSILVISVFGVLFGNRLSKVGFGITLLIFIGTTKLLLPILEKLPLSQLFWMMRFTPLALAMFFAALLFWKDIRKGILLAALVLLVIDCAISFNVLCKDAQMPWEVVQTLDQAVKIGSQRVALLDDSSFGSFPSFYISNNDAGKKMMQVFGSGWQEARTASNIVSLNTSIEKGWYTYTFDRCLEMGADTVVVKKDMVKDSGKLDEAAEKLGYEKKVETKLAVIYKYPIETSFATKPLYEALGIGKYAGNLSFMFPEVSAGSSEYLDDYSENELLKYKVIYLSGFKYHDKSKAEVLVKRLSQQGLRFVIDLTGADSDVLTSRASFLGVMAQPVEFYGSFPKLNIGGNQLITGKLPEDNTLWRTIYLENLDKVTGNTQVQNQVMNIIGTKYNDNIVFVGLNLPFFAMETQDANTIAILGEITGLMPYETPKREIAQINIEQDKQGLKIKTDRDGVLTGIAALDTLKAPAGTWSQMNNMILMNDRELELKTTYPYFIPGAVISLLGLMAFAALISLGGKKKTVPGSLETRTGRVSPIAKT